MDLKDSKRIQKILKILKNSKELKGKEYYHSKSLLELKKLMAPLLHFLPQKNQRLRGSQVAGAPKKRKKSKQKGILWFNQHLLKL